MIKIYRFEKNCAERLKTIQERSIFISSPEKFNDLDDSRLAEIFFPEFDIKDYNKILQCTDIFYKNSNSGYFQLPEDLLGLLRNYLELKLNIQSTQSENTRFISDAKIQSIVVKIRKKLMARTGICCFFKDVAAHPLMWAHYGDSHRGFCVEYEVENFDDDFHNVNYSSEQLKPSITEFLFCPRETITKILTTKSFEWNYEKECRLLYVDELQDGNGKQIKYPESMKPSQLIKGQRFNEKENAELIANISVNVISYKEFISKKYKKLL